MKTHWIIVIFFALCSCSTNRKIEVNTLYYVHGKNFYINFLNDSVCKIMSRQSLAEFISYGSYIKNRRNVRVNMATLTEYEKINVVMKDSFENKSTVINFYNHYNQIRWPIVVGYKGLDSMLIQVRKDTKDNLEYFLSSDVDSIRVEYLVSMPFQVTIHDSMRGKKVYIIMPDDNLYTLRTRDNFRIKYHSLHFSQFAF